MALTDANAVARVKRLLSEENAKLASYTNTSFLFGDGNTHQTTKMVRFWSKISDGERVVAEDYLKAYASVKNTTESIYVVDPMADGEVREGRWRVSSVSSTMLKTDPAQQGVYEVLVLWPEGFGGDGSFCVESSPLHHEDATQEYMASAPVDVGHVSVIGEIRTARNSLDVETGLWNTELRVDQSREFGPVSTFSGSADESTEEISAENMGAAAVISAAAADVTGKIVRSSVGINRFGKLDTKLAVETGKEQITTEKVVAHSYEETTEQKTYQGAQVADPVAEVGFIKTVRNEASKYPRKWNVLTRIRKILRLDTAVQYDSADDADGHSVVEESLGQPNTPGGLAVVLTAGAGESLQASVQYDKESDTLDVRKATQTGKPQTHVTVSASAGADEVVTDKTYQDAALTPPVAEDGKVKQSKSVMSRFTGKFDTSESVRTVKKLEAVARGGGPLVTEETTVTSNADADTSGTAAGSDGEIVDSSARKNDAGKFDISVSKKTAVEKTATHASGGGLVSEQVTIVRNGSMPAPGTGGAGIITDVSASINEFGKIDSRASVRTAKVASGVAVSGGPLVQVTEEFVRNAQVPASPGAGGIGTIQDVSNSHNEFGLLDTRKTTQVAVESPLITSVHGGPMVRVETQERKNSTAQNPGQGAAGTINDLSQGVNQFGRVDWQKTTRTAIPFSTPLIATGGDAFSTEESRTDYNLPNAAAIPPIAGKVVRASASVNEFALVDARVTVSTPVSKTIGPHVIHDDGLKQITRTVHRNSPTVPTVSMDDNGHNITPNMNEFGKYDVVEEQTTIREFQIDIEEPTNGNQAPRFTRTHYGIDRASSLQAKVNAFMAYVTSKSTNHMYRVSSGVSRDSDGFYVLELTANPKESSGGGGSATQWEQGLDVDWPPAIKYQDCNSTRAYTKFTSSKSSAQSFIDYNHGTLVDSGVGGKTGCFYIGRGRFAVIKNIKVS